MDIGYWLQLRLCNSRTGHTPITLFTRNISSAASNSGKPNRSMWHGTPCLIAHSITRSRCTPATPQRDKSGVINSPFRNKNRLLRVPSITLPEMSSNIPSATSASLLFYVLVRHALVAEGLTDRILADYLAAMLRDFGVRRRANRIGDHDDHEHAYMVDAGASNLQTGHRTNLLDATQAQMASGVAPSVAGSSGANALLVLDSGTRSNPTSTPEGVAWPPKNAFVPYQLLPADSNRWSFQYPGANFSGATVSMTSGGLPYVGIVYDYKSGGCPSGFTCFPDDAVVWQPPPDSAGINGVFYTSPGAADKVYTVNITGVTGSGVPSSFSYTVTVIDPSIAPSQTITGTISTGTPLANVSFCARPAAGVTCTASDASGAYSCTVPTGWTGTLHSPSVANNRIPPQTFTTVNANVTRNVTALPGVPACNLDVDDNGLIEPETDGVAIIRRMMGYNGAAFGGLAGTCAANASSTAIFNATASNYNVTGGATTRAPTDGLVILRAMNGKTGTDVTNGLTTEPGAARTSWSDVQSWLNTTCGSSF